MILVSLIFTSDSIASVVSCTNIIDITQKTNYHVIPNVTIIKATIRSHVKNKNFRKKLRN
jgi:hypothetical protein